MVVIYYDTVGDGKFERIYKRNPKEAEDFINEVQPAQYGVYPVAKVRKEV